MKLQYDPIPTGKDHGNIRNKFTWMHQKFGTGYNV